MEDDLFVSELSGYDIIFLAETHVGHNFKAVLNGYKYFPVCRPLSKNGRHFGGLGIFIKTTIKPYVSVLPNTNKDFQCVKLDKALFHLDRDLYMCLIYYPPSQSSYTRSLSVDILQSLENDIIQF